MNIAIKYRATGNRLLLALALLLPAPLLAQDDAPVSPEAQAVIDRMTTFLQGLEHFSIEANASRDEVFELGYKIQNNERATLVVKRPNSLRAEVSGDMRDRSFYFDKSELTIFAPDEGVYVKTEAPDTLAELIGSLLEIGIEMPLIDVLYNATAGTLTDGVRGGILVGPTMVDGVECDQLAFRQAAIDWQLWVQRGPQPVPRKILITTRHEVGEPQYEATLHWNFKPKIDSKTFVFVPPKGVTQIPFAHAPADGGAP